MDATESIQAARDAEDLGAWDQALDLWRQARIQDPHDSRIARATARCLRRLGKPRQAAVLLEQQLQLQPEAIPLHLAALDALAEAGRWQALLASLAPLLNALPEDPELLATLQQASDHLQPHDLATGDMPATDLLAALHPWLPQELQLICALPDVDLDEACRRLPPPGQATPQHLAATLPSVLPGTKALLAPLDLAAHLPLWRTLIEQRGLQATVVLLSLHPVLALPALQQEFSLDVNGALDLWCRHQLLAERQSRDLPRQRLAATAPPPAAVPPPADPTPLARALDLHQALLHPNDDHCRREADRLTADPSPSSAAEIAQRLNLEAQAAADRGDLTLAVPLYRQAIAQMPQHRGLYPALARCLRRLDRAAEAETLLNRHLSEQPESAPGWIGLAEGARQQGHWQTALAHYDRALRLDPDHRGLPRAIAHTAERLLPPGDPAFALPAAELLAQLLPNLPQRLLLVLGMHRSGTSALAGLLAGEGLQLPTGSPPADPFNPRGYWEPLQLVACHNTLLEASGSRWDTPRHTPVPPSLDHLQELARALQADFPDAGAVALVKDPRQCRLQPLWNSLIEQRGLDAAVVLLHRHPLAVARSLQRRDGLPADRALLLWLQHLLEAERHSRHLPRLRCSYRKLLSDPAAVVQACRCLVPGLEPLKPGALDQLKQRIDPKLDHSETPMADADAPQPDLLALALEVHAALTDPNEDCCRAVCDQASLQLELRLQAASNQLGERETAQLFWCIEGQSFCEAASKRVGYGVHRGVVQAELPLPAGVGPLAAVRLDPGEQPGLIRFLELTCRNANGDELWRWSAADGTPLPCTAATHGSRLLQPAEGAAVLLAQDADPAVLIELPQAVLAGLASGGSFGFAVRWEPIGPDLSKLLEAL